MESKKKFDLDPDMTINQALRILDECGSADDPICDIVADLGMSELTPKDLLGRYTGQYTGWEPARSIKIKFYGLSKDGKTIEQRAGTLLDMVYDRLKPLRGSGITKNTITITLPDDLVRRLNTILTLRAWNGENGIMEQFVYTLLEAIDNGETEHTFQFKERK